MKWSLDDVPLFLAVVERGGITAAAAALGLPKSSLSKAVGRLEHGLGVRLFDRNSRRMRVTAEGETFHRHCQRIMEQVEDTDAVMGGLTARPRGRLTVAVPPAFCQEILAPHLGDFRRRYPDVDLDIVVTTDAVDVVGGPFDLAVVVGAQEDSALVRRTLLGGRLLWIASPAYAAIGSLGETPADLLPHIQVCERRYAARPLVVRWRDQAVSLDLRRRVMQINDPLAVREAVLRGAGVSFLPDRYCTRHIAAGLLVEVAPHLAFDMSASVLSVVFPGRRLLSARIRAFVDFLAAIDGMASLA